MNRRNMTTTTLAVAAGLLLYGGVTMAHDFQARDARAIQIVSSESEAPTDALEATGAPEATATADVTAEPTDDNGGANATAEPGDDNGGSGGSTSGSGDNATPKPTHSSGGSGSGSQATATPDSHGGSGGGGNDGGGDH